MTALAALVLLLALGGSGCGSNATSTGQPDATTQPNGGNATSTGQPDATTQLNATAFGQKYRFADNEIDGWTMDATDRTAYFIFTGDAELVARIDGAAGAYTDQGCRLGMYQDLVGPNSGIIEVVAMDYVTDAQATAMFTSKKQLQTATIPIPPYDVSVAIGISGLTGLTVLAHFKASYFELQLSGYGEQKVTCSACSVAKQFLDVLQSKTN
jgi:hypothetical protein